MKLTIKFSRTAPFIIISRKLTLEGVLSSLSETSAKLGEVAKAGLIRRDAARDAAQKACDAEAEAEIEITRAVRVQANISELLA